MTATRPAPEPPDGPRRPLARPVRAAITAVALALVLGACGERPAPEVTSAPGAASAERAAGPTLPTLPPAVERVPDAFDPQGCLRTGPEAVDCGQRGASLDAATAGHTEADWRSLAGFEGRFWTPDLGADRVRVLEASVRPAAGERWSARGLARNERAVPVAGITVVATLLAADGSVLETLSATSPVAAVRPGEPVPFELVAATTPPTAVASVRWDAVEAGGTVTNGTRELELRTYWTRAYGEDHAVDLYLHHDPPGGRRPYLLFGSVLDHGPAVSAPHVVVAWVDRDGGVLAVRDVAVADATGAAAASLGTGEALDFLVAVDDPVTGPALADAAPMLWGAGR